MANKRVSFGDNVRIRATPLTIERGLAGLNGHCFGLTTPSITRVEVIGATTADYALNVYFPEKRAGYWFAEELVEFVDHAPGIEVRLAGVRKKWTRTLEGGWVEESADD